MEPYPKSTGSMFIVRIWREWSQNGSGWRGQIEHVQSRQKYAFLNLGEMVKFMQGYVAISAGEDDSVKGGSTQRIIV